MSAITEVGTIQNNFARRQFDVLVFNKYDISVLTKLRAVEMRNWNTKCRKSNELFSVDTVRVSEHTTSVNDSDGLI